jgi:hypothetical protein
MIASWMAAGIIFNLVVLGDGLGGVDAVAIVSVALPLRRTRPFLIPR